jgi:hypothetical protein
VSNVVLGQSDPDRLIEALLDIPALADSDERDAHVEHLIAALRRPVDVDRFVDQRDDLASIVKSGLNYSGGMRIFTREVEMRHPGEAGSRAVAIADEISGVLSVLDRDALRRTLVGIPMQELVGAIGELGDVEELSSVVVWLDMSRVIRTIEGLPARPDGIPLLLAFVSRLTRLVSPERADDLRGWLDDVAGGLSVTPADLARLREPGVEGPGSEPEPPVRPVEEAGRVWGDVPIRNRNFTGRGELLDQLEEELRTSSKASVLPQTLHGMGGVGKTQLVIEYVHRHAAEYDLVWWIAAEQAATVLSSLSELAGRLGLPSSDDRQQTARTVLHALASATKLRWLLVYDNADDPDALDQFLPSSGGHVILTTRNQEWAGLAPAIAVDVFKRQESIDLLRKRSQERSAEPRISTADANELAEKLGDLPLALEQAVAWHLATAMPIKEYIALLDDRISELLSEGKPPGYPLSVAAFVRLAVQQLREIEQSGADRTVSGPDPATAQMFELFAYLGGDPIRVALLRFGRDADITQPLRGALGDSIRTNRMTRDLNRLGLAKLDASQRLQVHRLVQRVLRDTMSEQRAGQTLENTRNLLAAASPGDPDEQGEYARQREMGPHIEPADLINAPNLDARQAVIDHTRFLYLVGDYENSRLLAERAFAAWEQDTWHERLGPDGEFTLLARAHVANAMRTLGDSKAAAALTRDTYERFRNNPLLGPTHDFTLIIGNQFCADLRIAGEYGEALSYEKEFVDRCVEVFGPVHTYTLRALGNLAVDHRMIGDFSEALRIDQDIVQHWVDVGGTDNRELAARMNVARDLYGLGAYKAGLAVLDEWQGELHRRQGVRERLVLLAGRTRGVLQRKAGRHADAVRTIRDYYKLTYDRFEPHHEYTIAAEMSLANALREVGETAEAMSLMTAVLERYGTHFGRRHPLALVAAVNKAIVHRALEEDDQARALDEAAFRDLAEVLGPNHPYTLCAGSSLATDHARHGEREAALRLSTEILRRSRESSGGEHPARRDGRHPYLLMREINLALDMRAAGETKQAEAIRQEALSGLRLTLETGHPDLILADSGGRTEGDIEPPPT